MVMASSYTFNCSHPCNQKLIKVASSYCSFLYMYGIRVIKYHICLFLLTRNISCIRFKKIFLFYALVSLFIVDI